MTSVDLAARASVDPRTIDRLVADRSRTPRAHSRHAIAEAVQVPVSILWPEAPGGASAAGELLAVYPSRAAMPPGLVLSMLRDSTEQVDVLALAGLWMWDALAGFGSTLAARARGGARVRVCLGDEHGEAIRTRGAEEGIDDLLAARCRLSVTYARKALADTETEIRLHDTTLYASILRFDNQLLVNWHLFGAPAAESPVLHLRRTGSTGLAATVAASFERVWELAQPFAG